MSNIHLITLAERRKCAGRLVRSWRADAAAVMGDVCPHAIVSQPGVGFTRGDPAP